MRKKKVTSKACVNVQRLLDSVQIDPKRLIEFLETAVGVEETAIENWKTILVTHHVVPEIDLIGRELKLRYAQSLLYILKVAAMDGGKLKYINPSLN